MEALLGEPGGGESFASSPEVYERKALGLITIFMGAHLGNLDCAHLPWIF